MVELARLMSELGADEALNLDGGGSSTMVARKTNGKVRVLNSPSDGQPRAVPNGLEVFYTPPASRRPARGQPTTDSSTSTTATVVAAAKHSTGLVVALTGSIRTPVSVLVTVTSRRGVAADVDDRGVRRLVVGDLEAVDELDQPGLHPVVVELRGELLARRDVGQRDRARRDSCRRRWSR